MSQSLNMGAALSRAKNGFTQRSSGALAVIDGEGATPLPGQASRNLLLVPSEEVLILKVALPLPSHRKRVEVLPYAIEDRIAAGIDDVHLALAEAGSGGSYLACVVDPIRLRHWIDIAEAAGLGNAAIMPDVLALPLPADQHWTVMRQGARIIARMPDDRGFAASETNFLHLWTVSGKPVCDEIRQFPSQVPMTIDLRQGVYAPDRASLLAPWRRIAVVAALGLLAHIAIVATDTAVLRSIAARRGLELQAQFAASAPGVFGGSDPVDTAAIAADLLSPGSAVPPGPMVPLFAAAARALGGAGTQLKFAKLAFDAGGTLRFDLDRPDAAALDRARRALEQAGLIARLDGESILITGKSAA